ncbi:MAG: NuoF family protein [Dehalococcoidales bacterium]
MAASTPTVLVCQGTGCISAGAEQVMTSLRAEVGKLGLTERIEVRGTGCHGLCQAAPLVVVEPEGVLYAKVLPEDAAEIVAALTEDGGRVDRLLYHDSVIGRRLAVFRDIPFYYKQQRHVLRNCGNIDPSRIEDYVAAGGYDALRRALTDMSPAEVVDEVTRSGLRGLGGAGFPAGRKWQACRDQTADEKYVICNGDEGDPGAFQDCAVMEGDPHAVLEGMIIAGYAVGASQGYVFVRAEYPRAVARLRGAITQAGENGYLGEDILGSGFNFDIRLFQGAGAFVCGESTALVQSIEGQRGIPRAFPRPRTTEAGLWGKPTLLNNVKTLANVPLIVNHGADWFASRGSERCKGTAIFSLTGNVANTGLIEVAMGTRLREIIYDIGGGIPGGRAFKAVQTGGPSGGCLPAELLNLPVDFDSLTEAGAMMGSGGMVVMDQDTCMVDIARYFLDFTRRESCGQCVPCRVGTNQMFEILDGICRREGREGDIELLEELGKSIAETSLCALGKSAPNPVLTTLRYFRDEYEAHLHGDYCPAGVCSSYQ